MKPVQLLMLGAIASLLGGCGVLPIPVELSFNWEPESSAAAKTSSQQSSSQTPSSQKPSPSKQSDKPAIPAGRLEQYQTIEDFAPLYDALYGDRDFARITKTIQPLLAQETKDEATSLRLSRLYLRLGQIKGADQQHQPQDDAQFQAQKAVLDAWVEAEPDSHIPWLLRGFLLSSYAHEFRTNAFIRNVPEEDMEQARRLWVQSSEDLTQAAKLNRNDPNIWSGLLKIAVYYGGEEQRQVFYQAGTKVSPNHYNLHRYHHLLMHPSWGGSHEERQEFGEQLYQISQAEQWPLLSHLQLVGYRALRYEQSDFMAKPEIQARIRETYDRIFAQHPDYLRMRFFYAYDAFYSDQYALAAEQFELIGDRWIDDTIWTSLAQYHRKRALLYLKMGHDAFMAGDNANAQKWAERSNQLVPTANGMLLVGNAIVNQTGDPATGLEYSHRALELNPTPRQRKLAEDYIQEHGSDS